MSDHLLWMWQYIVLLYWYQMELWHELWHEGLEEASRLYFGERNVKGMFAVLEPLHAMMERGPQTMKETSFNQVSCRGQADKAMHFDTGGPRFEPRPGSSILGQGALSSLPSLSEET